ncbi:transposable element Tcb2 transposase [Trichonephila clavipes]|nr:transposable element Tcb2 transposase [Trichonephila clavipes]
MTNSVVQSVNGLCNVRVFDWVSGAVDRREYHCSILVVTRCTSCLGKTAQRLECRGLETSSMKWSRFRLFSADGRLRIWRKAHKAIDPASQVKTVQEQGCSIMVWGVFSWHCLGSLV